MKRLLLILCMVLCILGTACGRKQAVQGQAGGNGQNQPAKSTIGEVYPACDYEYSYKEKKDGTVEFTIKGKWDENSRWEAESSVEEVVSISPVKEDNNKITCVLSPEIDGSGYSDVTFQLCDAGGKSLYLISALAVTDEKGKLSVDSVNYYEGGLSEELSSGLTGGVEEEVSEEAGSLEAQPWDNSVSEGEQSPEVPEHEN